MFMFLGTSGNVHAPINHYSWLLPHHFFKRIQQIQLRKHYLGKSQNLKHRNCRKGRVPKSLRSVLPNPERLEHGIEQYLPNNMKWESRCLYSSWIYQLIISLLSLSYWLELINLYIRSIIKMSICFVFCKLVVFLVFNS